MAIIQWNRGESRALSPNFSTTEFTCQCGSCGPQQIESDLITKLEALRAAIGTGIQINSGYRCAAHQAELLASGNFETVKNSTHVLGHAADIRPIKLGIMDTFLAEAAKQFASIGIAHTWLHCDLRPGHPDGTPRRWYYK